MIYASSPSYLITAGGSPSTYAINPRIAGIVPPGQDQQLGVAVTTSFMPAGNSGGYPNNFLFAPHSFQNNAADLIQFGGFSDDDGEMFNYGVAPDFACGNRVYIPVWCKHPVNGSNDFHGNFQFINCGSNGVGPGSIFQYIMMARMWPWRLLIPGFIMIN